MKSLSDCSKKELNWSQPKLLKREFELRDGSEVVGRLNWHRPFGSLATGEVAEGSWTFKRAGFLRPRVIVRPVDSDQAVARYEAGWAGGGRLLYPGGHGYHWRQRSFWKTEWAFEDERGQIVAQFQADQFVLKESVRLTLADVKSSRPDHALLALLGLYLMILSNDDAVTAVVVTG